MLRLQQTTECGIRIGTLEYGTYLENESHRSWRQVKARRSQVHTASELKGATSFRSWFQKNCLLYIVFLLFFFTKKNNLLKVETGIWNIF